MRLSSLVLATLSVSLLAIIHVTNLLQLHPAAEGNDDNITSAGSASRGVSSTPAGFAAFLDEFVMQKCECLLRPAIPSVPDAAGLFRAWMNLTQHFGTSVTRLDYEWSLAALHQLLRWMERDLRVFQYPLPGRKVLRRFLEENGADTDMLASVRLQVPGVPSVDTLLSSNRNSAYDLDSIFWHVLRQSKYAATPPAEQGKTALFQLPIFSGRWELVARKAQKRLNGGPSLPQMSARAFGGFLTTAMVGIVIAWIRASYPHYDRSAGRDHFWIVSHDAGKAETSGFAPESLASNATCLANTADPLDRHPMYVLADEREMLANASSLEGLLARSRSREPRPPHPFDPKRDISLAPSADIARANYALTLSLDDDGRTANWNGSVAERVLRPDGGLLSRNDIALADAVAHMMRKSGRYEPHLRSGHRPTFAFFAGRWGIESSDKGHLRREIFEAFLRARARNERPIVIEDRMLRTSTYTHHLQRSTFCLCPEGTRSCFWDWTSLAMFVPRREAKHTYAILAGISEARVRSMQRALIEVRPFLMYHLSEAVRGDAFHMTLLELYMRHSLCVR
ncbi:unnamed protein product [Vitrella brassicaformis CCMP3155]|uniref:Uncharacterized protein n=1 Tax=Vitrella brassicaformis (strain CCMP3155) TaxID=1169540 RepID=A0A0G4EUL4_VITBC|nr:unnamed protein product [Vitrella brassicaformis CCMP3155]|eukprot:CEM02000.1 unnamed protein product [Vitrella brassicaformis CCMP3155]